MGGLVHIAELGDSALDADRIVDSAVFSRIVEDSVDRLAAAIGLGIKQPVKEIAASVPWSWKPRAALVGELCQFCMNLENKDPVITFGASVSSSAKIHACLFCLSNWVDAFGGPDNPFFTSVHSTITIVWRTGLCVDAEFDYIVGELST